MIFGTNLVGRDSLSRRFRLGPTGCRTLPFIPEVTRNWYDKCASLTAKSSHSPRSTTSPRCGASGHLVSDVAVHSLRPTVHLPVHSLPRRPAAGQVATWLPTWQSTVYHVAPLRGKWPLGFQRGSPPYGISSQVQVFKSRVLDVPPSEATPTSTLSTGRLVK